MNTASVRDFDSLRTRITENLRSRFPEAIEERLDHMAYTLTTAHFEVQRRDGREPSVQRAWAISLAQVGLTKREARDILAKCLGRVSYTGRTLR